MKKVSITILAFLVTSLGCLAQVNVASPAATEFVRCERIPVSYFNGLPSIDIPLYSLDYKDLHLPVHLSYNASGIRLNQYPTCVGSGWNLNAGGCITRVVNGIPDETTLSDVADQTGVSISGVSNPGYYFSAAQLCGEDWTSEESLAGYANYATNIPGGIDLQPDEFVINAYGVSGSVYFYRDETGNVKSKVRSNNGESFRVETPVLVHNPQNITFYGNSDTQLKAYRIHELFYSFTVVKNDGTKLIFGGDYNAIEFYTEKRIKSNVSSSGTNQYMKTWPTSWMLKKVISPRGSEITFDYQRNGSPIIVSDVRTDVTTYSPGGAVGFFPSQDSDRGLSFIVQHPVYPKSISVDGCAEIRFFLSRSNSMGTVNSSQNYWIQYDAFSDHVSDGVSYNKTNATWRIPYSPHNYFMKLSSFSVADTNGHKLRSIRFDYTDINSERMKLSAVSICGSTNITEQKYTFKYNNLKLPAYNATVTDNWGYWNNKNYRSAGVGDELFSFRTANETYAKAEILQELQYPTGGTVRLEYELNDYSKVTTQAPDFTIEARSGKAGGLRIKRLTYTTDTTSYVHSFEYKNEDGTSSGILSGIPVYVAEGGNYNKYDYSGWDGLVHFHYKANLKQQYRMVSETYVNALGLTSGNHVTYSRVIEKIGNESPLVKEYRYTNHEDWPDTADFSMYTNIDNVSLDNKFTSRALMRGLLTDEIWYSEGKKVKEVKQSYNSNPDRFEDYVRSVDQFSIPGVPGLLVALPFVRYAPYKILTFYPYLESRSETLYDPSGEKMISSVTDGFSYNGNLMPVRMTSNMSDGGVKTVTTTYPNNYGSSSILNQMNTRGMISSPVETVTYIDGKVTDARLVDYLNNNGIITPRKYWTLGLTEPLDSAMFTKYAVNVRDSRYVSEKDIINVDSSGNPLLVKSMDGTSVSCKWGYSSAYPTAVVSGAANTYKEHITGDISSRADLPGGVSKNESRSHSYTGGRGRGDSDLHGQDEFLYEDFESCSSDSTNIMYPFGYHSDKCYVGQYQINLKGTSDRKYVLDYMVYRKRHWRYARVSLPSRSYTIDEGLDPIDNVRVYPEDSSIETYTWYPLIGLRSRTDGAGVTEVYTYDAFGRLQCVSDGQGNIKTKYDYNYGGLGGNTIQ